jgi:hypothetical protein
MVRLVMLIVSLKKNKKLKIKDNDLKDYYK